MAGPLSLILLVNIKIKGDIGMDKFYFLFCGFLLIATGCASGGKVSPSDAVKYPRTNISVSDSGGHYPTCQDKAVAWKDRFIKKTEDISRAEGKPIFQMKIIDPEINLAKTTFDSKAFTVSLKKDGGSFEVGMIGTFIYTGSEHQVQIAPGVLGVKQLHCRPAMIEHLQKADPNGQTVTANFGGGVSSTIVGGKHHCPSGTSIGMSRVFFAVDYVCPSTDSMIGSARVAEAETINPMFGATVWDPDPATIEINWDVLKQSLDGSAIGNLD